MGASGKESGGGTDLKVPDYSQITEYLIITQPSVIQLKPMFKTITSRC